MQKHIGRVEKMCDWYRPLREKAASHPPYWKPYWWMIWRPMRVRYEYRCPFCGHVNIRYEPCRRIVCDRCGREFTP